MPGKKKDSKKKKGLVAQAIERLLGGSAKPEQASGFRNANKQLKKLDKGG